MPDTQKPLPATPLNPRRRAIVLGASVGLGAALSKKLIQEGCVVALVARQKDKLDALCSELNQTTGETRALAYVHDVSKYQKDKLDALCGAENRIGGVNAGVVAGIEA